MELFLFMACVASVALLLRLIRDKWHEAGESQPQITEDTDPTIEALPHLVVDMDKPPTKSYLVEELDDLGFRVVRTYVRGTSERDAIQAHITAQGEDGQVVGVQWKENTLLVYTHRHSYAITPVDSEGAPILS